MLEQSGSVAAAGVAFGVSSGFEEAGEAGSAGVASAGFSASAGFAASAWR